MTREEFEDEKYSAVDNLELAAEAIESTICTEYDADDDFDDIISKAEDNIESIMSALGEFKEKIQELRELKREENEIEGDD